MAFSVAHQAYTGSSAVRCVQFGLQQVDVRLSMLFIINHAQYAALSYLVENVGNTVCRHSFLIKLSYMRDMQETPNPMCGVNRKRIVCISGCKRPILLNRN